MFLEPYSRSSRTGWLEVITGCMFSGKTEELIRRLKRAKIANMTVQIVIGDDAFAATGDWIALKASWRRQLP